MDNKNLPPEYPWQSMNKDSEQKTEYSHGFVLVNEDPRQNSSPDNRQEYNATTDGIQEYNSIQDSTQQHNSATDDMQEYDSIPNGTQQYNSTADETPYNLNLDDNTVDDIANNTTEGTSDFFGPNFDYGTYNDYGPRGRSYTDYKNGSSGISKKAFILVLIIAMLLTSALTVGGMILYENYFSNGSHQATNYTLSKDTKQLSSDSIVKKTNSSVVSIVTESVSTDSWAQNYVKKGAGSGVIIQKNGYILTCNHVIQGASKIKVTLSNNKSYDAKLVGASPDDDLAVLKINAVGLNTATYGNSSKLAVGDHVVAIGNPLGELSNTASTGIISALNRKLTIGNKKLNLLQTDASINPGNSGGALFNGSGNLIGIVVAKSAGSNVEGLGFAIPINHAAKIAKTLIKSGNIKSKSDSGNKNNALIGVTIHELSESEARREGYDKGGVFIASVASSYAKDAGLKAGDRIASFDGKEITGANQLREALAKHKAGDKVKIEIVRNKQKINTSVTLISGQQ